MNGGPMTEGEIALAVKLRKRGLAWTAVAKKVGRDRTTIVRTLTIRGFSKEFSFRTKRADEWRPDEVATAQEMRNANKTWKEISAALGRSEGACRNRIRYPYRNADRMGPVWYPARVVERVEIPDEVLAERDRMYSCTPTISQRLLGDPLPGRSALERKTLLELKAGECRWPFGDGPFMFCGCRTLNGKSYCAEHYLKAYA